MKWWGREAAAPKLCDEQAESFFSTSNLSLFDVFVAVIVVVIRALSNPTNHKWWKEKKADETYRENKFFRLEKIPRGRWLIWFLLKFLHKQIDIENNI